MDVRSEQFRTDLVPEILYYQAFLAEPDLDPAERDFLFLTNSWRGWQTLPERFGEMMGKYDGQFRLAPQAAQAQVPCHWGIDMRAGPATLLPKLASAKVVTQAARLRALWHLQEGHPVREHNCIAAV